MAKNTNSRRNPIKWVRDGVKVHYKKGNQCEICGTTKDLEYHHYHSMANLVHKYVAENNIPFETDDDALAMRDEFYQAHWFEVVEDAATLCNSHHTALHKVFGKAPKLSTVDKQRQWVLKQAGQEHDQEQVISKYNFATYVSEGLSFTQFLT